VPLGLFLGAIFANLEDWSLKGRTLPHGEPMAVTAPGTPQAQARTDRFGNILGGVRSPQLDVPIARYHASMEGPGICSLWGWREPLSKSELSQLYPTRSVYVAKVKANVAKLVRERWLEQADGEALIEQANETDLPAGTGRR
jgi:hypothetical protein